MSASQLFLFATIEVDGKPYTMNRPSIKTIGTFAAYLEGRAVDGYNRQRFRMGDEAYGLALAAFGRDVAAGEYVWGEGDNTASKALNTDFNAQEMMFLVLSQAEPNLTRATVKAMWADPAVKRQIIDAWIKVTAADPTIASPEPAEASAPV